MSHGPLAMIIDNLFSQLNKVVSLIIYIIVIFFQAIHINFVGNQYRFTGGINYIIGFSYIILISLFSSSIYISSDVLLLSLITTVFARLMAMYKNKRCFNHIFDIGLFSVLCILINPNLLPLILVPFIGFFIMRPFDLKELLTVGLGIISPVIMITSYYFWIEETNLMLSLMTPEIERGSPDSNWLNEAKIIAILTLILAGMISANLNRFKHTIETRKLLQITILITIALLLSDLALGISDFKHYFYLVVPLSIFLGHLFTVVRKSIARELIVLVFLTIIGIDLWFKL